MTTDLEPCPICGRKPVLVDKFAALKTYRCGHIGSGRVIQHELRADPMLTVESAARNWNAHMRRIAKRMAETRGGAFQPRTTSLGVTYRKGYAQ